MKKTIFAVIAVMMGAVIFIVSPPSTAGMEYECWTYVSGHPDKMTHIVADNKSEAESLVVAKFRDLGVKWDYIKCH